MNILKSNRNLLVYLFLCISFYIFSICTTCWSYPWPVRGFTARHEVSGHFGEHRNSNRFHIGTDIRAPENTPVYSIESGIVRYNNIVGTNGVNVGNMYYYHLKNETLPDPGTQVAGILNADGTINNNPTPSIGVTQGGTDGNHVHLQDYTGGHLNNALRIGGLEPYMDGVAPTVYDNDTDAIIFFKNNSSTELQRNNLYR